MPSETLQGAFQRPFLLGQRFGIGGGDGFGVTLGLLLRRQGFPTGPDGLPFGPLVGVLLLLAAASLCRQVDRPSPPHRAEGPEPSSDDVGANRRRSPPGSAGGPPVGRGAP
jgi:hypothetical protein